MADESEVFGDDQQAVSRFLGGSPAMVAVRLIVVSFVVGIVLETFGFEPAMLFSERRARRETDRGTRG